MINLDFVSCGRNCRSSFYSCLSLGARPRLMSIPKIADLTEKAI
jgi:hypothetical protein